MSSRPRAHAIDWLRGAAALAMVQCHALVLLRPELRTDFFGALLGVVDGVVAPAFYLCAGFALGYTLVNAARSGSRVRRSIRIVLRIGQVLAISAALSWQWFPIFVEPKWLLRIDVLSCIGLSLLVLLPICALLASRPKWLASTLLALAAAILVLAPALGRIDGPLAPFLGIRGGSVFPLVPWGAHLALGAGIGALLAAGSSAELLWSAVACACTLLMLAARASESLLHPPDPWSAPSDQLMRMAMTAVFGFGFARLERRASEVPSTPRRALEWFGTTSLWLYAFHEVWLYTARFGFCFAERWSDRLSWPGYALAMLALLAAATLTIFALKIGKQLARATREALRALASPRPPTYPAAPFPLQ